MPIIHREAAEGALRSRVLTKGGAHTHANIYLEPILNVPKGQEYK